MGSKGKAPDNSRQIEELDRQKQEAEDRANELAADSLEVTNNLRRRRFGKASLLRTAGGALGVTDKMGAE